MRDRKPPKKVLEKNTGSKLFDFRHSKILQTHLQKQREKNKNELLGVHQDKELLHSKRNNQQN